MNNSWEVWKTETIYDLNRKPEKYEGAHQEYINKLTTNLAVASLNIGAIKLQPEKPFQWASGFMMPIYNDNRLLLSEPVCRTLVARIFDELMMYDKLYPDIIAGTSTSGIPPATTLADMRGQPLIYVRDEPKKHGLRNQIEGIADDSDLTGKAVLLIEDLISTGGSSVKTVQAIRNANGTIDNCFSIFTYGFAKAEDMFAGKEPYDKEGNKLSTPCKVTSALTYDKLLQVAKDIKYLTPDQIQLLEEWRADPWNWGEKHGFPKVEKK